VMLICRVVSGSVLTVKRECDACLMMGTVRTHTHVSVVEGFGFYAQSQPLL